MRDLVLVSLIVLCATTVEHHALRAGIDGAGISTFFALIGGALGWYFGKKRGLKNGQRN